MLGHSAVSEFSVSEISALNGIEALPASVIIAGQNANLLFNRSFNAESFTVNIIGIDAGLESGVIGAGNSDWLIVARRRGRR